MAKMHLIGNAHVDPVWLWRWQEGYSEVLATFRSALDRMKEFPEFKFTSACAAYYQWVEQIDKDMFDEICQRVKEGRWNVVGGWFIQPDCNIPCGESFARQALISQRYFKEKFGVTAKTGYNVDSFGHSGSLPQILKKSGMDNYVFMRPMECEKSLEENTFLWESADGSQVCAYRVPRSYTLSRVEQLPEMQEYKERADEKNKDMMFFYGVGNHGGGPTIRVLNGIEQMNLPDTFFSTPDEFFQSVDKTDLPVVADELQHHARGCYSASAYVKAENRKCENNLLAAEKLCSMAAHLVGAKYPKTRLNKAWKNVLFNQFHDIMGGCSIKAAYEDAGYLYGETMSITEQAMNLAMQSIAYEIDTMRGQTAPCQKDGKREEWIIWKHIWLHESLGTPVVVFNPHSWPVRQQVEVAPQIKVVTDEHGNEVPAQIVRGRQTNHNGDKFRTAFIADIEPMGYRVYRLFPGKESTTVREKELHITERTLENSRLKAEFSDKTGDICRLYDKTTGKMIIDRECSAVLLDETAADTWAHDKEYLGEVIGSFGEPEFEIIEDGDVRVTLRVTAHYGNSLLRRDYTLVRDSSVLNVKLKVDFHEKHRTLKLTFPAESEMVTAGIPYGTIQRKKGLGEEPCGAWIASGNLCVANDSKHGYDTTDDEMRLTILRGAVYADHYGQDERDGFCEYMDQGVHECAYSLGLYGDKAEAERRAAELNFGLRAVMAGFHKGSLPESGSCFACESENVIVTAVKQSEDGEDTILRFVESNGEKSEVSLQLFGKTIRTEVSPYEIKTFSTQGTELNLIEW